MVTAAQSEAELLAEVRELADRFGWERYHTFNSMHSEAGFPDLVLGHKRRGQLLVAELKSERGRLTVEQEAWLSLFHQANVETHVWRPRHFNAVAWRLSWVGYRYDDVADAATIAVLSEGAGCG